MDEFRKFLEIKRIPFDDPRVPLLKEAWNMALELADAQMWEHERCKYHLKEDLGAHT